MTLSTNDERLLKVLAATMFDRPRATLQELAGAAGMSKATLHRFCGTRDNLVEMLKGYGEDVLIQVISKCEIESAEPLAALRKLIQEHLMHSEVLSLLMLLYRPDSLKPSDSNTWQSYSKVTSSARAAE